MTEGAASSMGALGSEYFQLRIAWVKFLEDQQAAGVAD